MDALKLKQLIIAGPVVIEFGKEAPDFEVFAEAGMRAHLKDVVYRAADEVIIEVDYSAFEEYNKSFEVADYYDKNRQPTLTPREAGVYTGDDSFYVAANQELDEIFTVLSDDQSALVKEFVASDSTSYVRWLEEQLIAARGQT